MKSVIVRRNYFNPDGWFSFWYPAKYAARQSADELNKSSLEYNALQDQLEANTSMALTKSDNIKIIIAIALICGVLVLTK
jgi:hypothetical protein